jgi:hypothetical protein
MSPVSFASVLRCGAFSADGPPEPFLELSTDATPVVVALLRLRRRRADRLVPLPVPAAVVVPAPLPPGSAELVESPPSGLLRLSPPDDER